MGEGRSKTPRLRSLRYVGGHPAAPNELDHTDMTFDAAGVHFARRDQELGAIAWDDVIDLAADAVTTTSRMTVPRVWLLGVFAAVFKNRERFVLLRVQDRRGAWLFEVDGITLSDLRAGIAAIRAKYAV